MKRLGSFIYSRGAYIGWKRKRCQNKGGVTDRGTDTCSHGIQEKLWVKKTKESCG